MTETITEKYTQEKQVAYARFWSRAGAYLLDGVIVGSVTFTINFINIANFKSFLIYLIIAVLGMVYKPFLESKYGATYGKMALGLAVVDTQFNRIDYRQSFIRSLIFIVPALLYIPIYFLAFNNPQLTAINNAFTFGQQIALEYPLQGFIGTGMLILLILDIVLLVADDTKKQRSLHDRIAKTYVIYKRK